MSSRSGSTILIVEDDPLQSSMLSTLVERKLGNPALTATSGQEAIDIISSQEGSKVGMVVMDMNMPGITGMEALKVIMRRWPHLPVVFLTGTQDAELAVKAMKLGAFDYIVKPYEAERMIVTLRNALQIRSLSQKAGQLKWTMTGDLKFSDLIGHAGGLKDLVTMGRKVAASDIPVLIMGETGVGKEVFARALHGESNRAAKPFVAINCAAIPASLIESILFGHEKGAFTGATAMTPGKFREADGGTIFLDEIGEMPAESQTKLLRVLQQKEVEPVGAAAAVPVNVRVISATNRDLAGEVAAGRFREDLFFRLNVVPLTLPPLRRRKEDISPLVTHFMERFAEQEHRPSKKINDEAVQHLENWHWPGNVRELENALRRALVLSDGDMLGAADFFLQEAHAASSSPPGRGVCAPGLPLLDGAGAFRSFEALEKDIMSAALDFCGGNMAQAARMLGVGKSTLYRKIGGRQTDTDNPLQGEAGAHG